MILTYNFLTYADVEIDMTLEEWEELSEEEQDKLVDEQYEKAVDNLNIYDFRVTYGE